jgi:hypothetical protein
MINDWRRIVTSDLHTGSYLLGERHGMWLVNVTRWDTSQFRYITSDIRTVGIKLLPLTNRIKDAKVGLGIGTGTGSPLPATIISCRIAIKQQVHEVAFAPTPINEQVFGQKRGDDHASAIVHPAFTLQLPHRCINDRVAGLTLLPSRKEGWIIRPGNAIIHRFEAPTECVRKVIEHLYVEITPDQFTDPTLWAWPWWRIQCCRKTLPW